MNFCSCIGRLGSGFAGQAFGTTNMVILATGSFGAVTLGMIGVKSVASVVLVGIFAGIFFGACKCSCSAGYNHMARTLTLI